MADAATEREIASRLADLMTAAKAVPVAPKHREAELIAEFIQHTLIAIDAQETLRALLDDYRMHADRVEAQLATERASHRKLRLALRELASGWSRYPETSPLHDAWEAAERQLTSILDTDQ